VRLRVRVKPGARQDSVSREPDGSLLVSVHERAHEGRANEAVVAAVAKHFHVPKTSVTIVSGHKSRNKVLDLPD
jgi:uncharacterized protein